MRTIELIYFDGCPNADAARTNLRQALEAANLPMDWREWDQHDPNAPERVRKFGSPTVLVDGNDVTGIGAGAVASACRTDGPPSIAVIQAALGRSEQTRHQP